MEQWFVTENEKAWLCPCCERPNGFSPMCQHWRERQRRNEVASLVARIRGLDLKSLREIYTALAAG